MPHFMSSSLGRVFGVVLASGAWLGDVASAQTTRISVNASGLEGDRYSRTPTISADGRFVAFNSAAWNLVSGDTGWDDAFVFDRETGLLERISVDPSGGQANGNSYAYSFSADGRFVVFFSSASNLVPNDSNGKYDVFVRDRASGTTERISVDSAGVESNGDSYLGAFGPSISSDGSIIVFESAATNLTVNDTNASSDVFLHNRTAGSTTCLSIGLSGVPADSYSAAAALSGDGARIIFVSGATNLVPSDNNGFQDLFLYDAFAGTLAIVSVDPSGGPSNEENYHGSISSDGELIAFTSFASNLVPFDSNGLLDVFVRDVSSQVTTLASVDMSGGTANGHSWGGKLSGDGAVMVFESAASDLVAGDSGTAQDIFLRDLVTGTTSRISVNNASEEGNGRSGNPPDVSGAGDLVVFESDASNLVPNDTNGCADIFLRDLSCDIDASWSNYGVGFPGWSGVPPLTAQNDPVLGTKVFVDLGNSANSWTIAALLVGFQQAQIPLKKGGDLLVIPIVSSILAIPPTGTTVSADIAADPSLCGQQIFVQTLIVDPGAAKGQSASAGLELVLGH